MQLTLPSKDGRPNIHRVTQTGRERLGLDFWTCIARHAGWREPAVFGIRLHRPAAVARQHIPVPREHLSSVVK